jgi:hypothetical protein
VIDDNHPPDGEVSSHSYLQYPNSHRKFYASVTQSEMVLAYSRSSRSAFAVGAREDHRGRAAGAGRSTSYEATHEPQWSEILY